LKEKRFLTVPMKVDETAHLDEHALNPSADLVNGDDKVRKMAVNLALGGTDTYCFDACCFFQRWIPIGKKRKGL
jgi:hypothetical protein